VTGSATLNGDFQAGGKVIYEYFSDTSECSGTPTATVTVPVESGSVSPSVPEPFYRASYYSWEASYGGDTNNNGATSQCELLAVNSVGASISTRLSAQNNVSIQNNAITMGNLVWDNATLSGTKGTAGGSVTYHVFSEGYCSGTPIWFQTVLVNGSVPRSDSYNFNHNGSYSWNAVYSWIAASSSWNELYTATSPCEPLTVSGPASTTVKMSCSAVSVLVGSKITCEAMVQGHLSTLKGIVKWSATVSGRFSRSSCKFHGFNVTCSTNFTPTAAGSFVYVTASYGGDSTNAASNGSSSLNVMMKATKMTISCSGKYAPAGSSTTCTARVTGYAPARLPTGTVIWSQSRLGLSFNSTTCILTHSYPKCSVTVTGVALGHFSINATYEGDTNYYGISAPVKLIITRAHTGTVISCASQLFGAGTNVTCTATVSSGYPFHNGTVTWSEVSKTGLVTFSPARCTLSFGTCSVTVTASAAGSVKIKAAYSGDSDDLNSSGTLLLTIN
jgi:hypothetical protein